MAKCRTCNGLLSLIMQINGDLPDWYPEHERRLYIFSCKRKACRRKTGSVRAIRAVRKTVNVSTLKRPEVQPPASASGADDKSRAATNVGEALFGSKPPVSAQANPFASSSSASITQQNPFASGPVQRVAGQEPSTALGSLTETFAQKIRLSSPLSPVQTSASASRETWPERTAFPDPYSSYFLDADKEYIEEPSPEVPSNARLDRTDGDGGMDMKDAFESSMDKTFQRFADRLSQNPEQVLRYEFGGQPLLYSKTDAVGKVLSYDQKSSNAKIQLVSSKRNSSSAGMPKCANCSAQRTFELQLTPHLITELESDESGLDGMDWGTILLGVCSANCQEHGKGEGEVGYVEEWAGVQWEELAEKRRT